jgi:hypothetical protein
MSLGNRPKKQCQLAFFYDTYLLLAKLLTFKVEPILSVGTEYAEAWLHQDKDPAGYVFMLGWAGY